MPNRRCRTVRPRARPSYRATICELWTEPGLVKRAISQCRYSAVGSISSPAAGGSFWRALEQTVRLQSDKCRACSATKTVLPFSSADCKTLPSLSSYLGSFCQIVFVEFPDARLGCANHTLQLKIVLFPAGSRLLRSHEGVEPSLPKLFVALVFALMEVTYRPLAGGYR
jgi:hypothetical protein